MQEIIRIRGRRPLNGSVTISGSKNATVALIPAAVLANGPVTIVGYDEFNTHLLDPGGEEWYYYGINDSTEMFAKQGNQFFACG